MSHKSTQARQKAATQAKLGVRTQTIAPTKPSVRTEMTVQARPQVLKEHSHKVEVPKVRGWAFTTWLILLLVANALTICLSGVTLVVYIMQHQPTSLYWSVIAALIFCTLTVISTIGVLKWKKWGFYLFMVTAGCSFISDIVLGQLVVVRHSVSLTHPGVYSTNSSVYITWPMAMCLMWLLAHSKKRWPMFR